MIMSLLPTPCRSLLPPCVGRLPSTGVTDAARHDDGSRRDQRDEMQLDKQDPTYLAPLFVIDAEVRIGRQGLAPANENDRAPDRKQADQHEQANLHMKYRIVQVEKQRLRAERDTADAGDEHQRSGDPEPHIRLRQCWRVDAIGAAAEQCPFLSEKPYQRENRGEMKIGECDLCPHRASPN